MIKQNYLKILSNPLVLNIFNIISKLKINKFTQKIKFNDNFINLKISMQ